MSIVLGLVLVLKTGILPRVGIYVKQTLKFNVLSAQSIFVDRIFESLFIQLSLSNLLTECRIVEKEQKKIEKE